MGRKEVLRKRSCLLTLPNFIRDLSEYVAVGEQVGDPTNIVLVTYNRVGEGLFEPITVKGGLTMVLYQGLMMTAISPDRMLSSDPVTENELGFLTAEQVADFFGRVRNDLVDQVKTLDEPTLFVIYAGESGKFRLAVDFVSKLSSLAKMAGKGDLAKFYLLSCSCGLAEKARAASPLCDTGLLELVVYNPAGACGGLSDLGTIAEAVLNAVPE